MPAAVMDAAKPGAMEAAESVAMGPPVRRVFLGSAGEFMCMTIRTSAIRVGARAGYWWIGETQCV